MPCGSLTGLEISKLICFAFIDSESLAVKFNSNLKLLPKHDEIQFLGGTCKVTQNELQPSLSVTVDNQEVWQELEPWDENNLNLKGAENQCSESRNDRLHRW